MLSETICIYGEMAKNHLCITDVTKRFAKKCALLYNLGQKCQEKCTINVCLILDYFPPNPVHLRYLPLPPPKKQY